MLSKPTGLIAFLFLASSLTARPQTDKSEALKLLDKVSKRYADATSYRIEAIKESRLSSELSSSWHKEMLTAEQARGNLYRFEGRSSSGSGIVVESQRAIAKNPDLLRRFRVAEFYGIRRPHLQAGEEGLD